MEEATKSTNLEEPLVSNVFNYEIGMMRKYVHASRKEEDVDRILAHYDSELGNTVDPLEHDQNKENVPMIKIGRQDHTENNHTISTQSISSNTRVADDGLPTSPLLSRIWNYDLGMMVDKSFKKRTRRLPPQHAVTPTNLSKKSCITTDKNKSVFQRTPLTPLSVNNNPFNTFDRSMASTQTSTKSGITRDVNKSVFDRSPLTPISVNNNSFTTFDRSMTGTQSSAHNNKKGSKKSCMKSNIGRCLPHDNAPLKPISVNAGRKATVKPTTASSCSKLKKGQPQKHKLNDDRDQNPVFHFLSDDSDGLSDPDYTDEIFDHVDQNLRPHPQNGENKFSMRLRNKEKEHGDMPFCALDFSENEGQTPHANYENDIEYSMIAGFESEYSDSESEYDFAEELNYDSDELSRATGKVTKEYATLGPPNVKCNKCNASMWREERVNKSNIKGTPIFSICCAKGQIQLEKEPPTPSFIWQLHNDKEKSKRFKDGIRLYNSLFAFTSTGGKVDHSVNTGGAPYIYRLNGQNHHLFGSLIPDDGNDPKFCQLYIYDTQNELQNRLKWVSVGDGARVDAEIVEGLTKMLDETNELVKEFRSARDRYEENGVQDLEIILKVSRSESGRENHITPSDEVAGVMVGDLDDTEGNRDIVLNSKIRGLERITDIHPKLMALQYPLLFPHGGDGFHKQIPFGKVEKIAQKRREKITMMEYYSYKFQVRTNEGMTPRLGGRLYQQYVVDAFSTIEQARLWWFRTHQTTLRSDVYTNIRDSINTGNNDTSNMGKGFILPAGFVGSRRYMQQNFQDALAVCRYIGHPDIFLTMTTNPLWDEILQMMKLIPHGSPQNSPDVIARVFRLKLDQLIDDIKKKKYFGTCLAVMYVVEFQKRGLPHVHMLIWLDSSSKKNLIANVDSFVSAEIPDPEVDRVGYEAVSSFMIHGPCGNENPKSPCMKQYKCTRHFPKKYSASTTFDQSGFPIYKRRKLATTVKKGKSFLDNQWVVPYNRDLLVKYQCHMNVEICAHARSLKYLFKYCLKGHDRATVEIRSKKRRSENGESIVQSEDEIQSFFDGRYICACEAAYRIFGFNIHYRSLAVQRLSFHLEDNKYCTFRSNEPIQKIAEREKEKFTQLEAYFFLNDIDLNARKFLYDEIPQHYVWNDADRLWLPRKRGKKIGRLAYTHHSSGELWYLRLLLTKVRGATSFESLRTVKGILYETYQEACKEYGLLDDDNEWDQVLSECAQSGFPNQIRQLFMHIMVNCKVSDLNLLWTKHWIHMVDDILLQQRKLTGNPHLILNEKQQQFFALSEIHNLLKSIGKSLKDYSQMPQPPSTYLDCGINNLILEETSYDTNAMENEFNQLYAKCNLEQLQVFSSVMNSVEQKKGGVFFVYGSGGCGKTYLWRTLISKLRSEKKIVLPVASSGIAATLMPGGRTAHSRFKIPIVLDDLSMCSISHSSDIAELIKRTELIIWDEAPMQHRYSFECLDRSLRDIMKAVDPNRFHLPFGGITVVFGGDFRQILPVIPRASRGEIVSACITNSKLWKIASVYKLVHNMRLNKGRNQEEVNALTEFAKWVLDVGDGKIPSCQDSHNRSNEDDILIPEKFCYLETSNSVDEMVSSTYLDFINNFQNPDYLSERAILTPTNVIVGNVNSKIVENLPGQSTSYYSVDTAEDYPGNERDQQAAFPPEYLNSINIPGMPLHDLKLKVGVVVMLMRNLNQTLGLCNGTRMMVTKCLKQCVECQVISGHYKGTKHFIPRMELSPTETTLPFKICRKQMPLQVCYAMTINKSQGQSLEKVALYLPKGVFTHGQLYVALSRVTSPDGLRLFIDDDDGNSTNITPNVVYKEVFYNLPVI